MSAFQQTNFLLIIIVAVVVGVIGYTVMTAPDQRNAGEKISDAINELPNGVDKAARQLEDRTPADKLGDAAEDAGDDFNKTMNRE
jgi:short subunit fatty acids transporter